MKFKVMIFWAAAWRGRQARTPDTAPQARIISFLEVELSNFVPPQPKRFFCVFESVLHFWESEGQRRPLIIVVAGCTRAVSRRQSRQPLLYWRGL